MAADAIVADPEEGLPSEITDLLAVAARLYVQRFGPPRPGQAWWIANHFLHASDRAYRDAAGIR